MDLGQEQNCDSAWRHVDAGPLPVCPLLSSADSGLSLGANEIIKWESAFCSVKMELMSEANKCAFPL